MLSSKGTCDRILEPINDRDFIRHTGKLRMTGSDLRTQDFIEYERKDTTAWACSYIHRDKESDLLRWQTEIGIKKIASDICVFHILVTMIPEPTLLDQGMPERKPAIPRIIRTLVDDSNYIVSLDKRYLLPLQRSPHVVTVKNIKELNYLSILLKDPLRSYVLIVCRGKQLDVTARELGKKLVSKAQVILVDEEGDIAPVISSILEHDNDIESEKLRVFFPPYLLKDSAKKENRVYDPLGEVFDQQKEKLIESLLSNFEVKAFDAVESLADVDSMVRMSQLRYRLTCDSKKALTMDVDELSKELEAAKSLIDESIHELEKKQAAIEGIQHDKSVLEERIDVLNTELNNERYQAREWEKTAEIKRENEIFHAFLQRLDHLPDLASVVEIMRERFKERLIFHEQAVQSAEEYAEFTQLSDAWALLYSMGTTLFDLKFGSGSFSEQAYNNRSNYILTMKEGTMTKKDKRLMNARIIEYQGESYEMVPHIKYGNRPPKCLRVYFCFLEQERKILIGYVGPHLENRTSQKIK